MLGGWRRTIRTRRFWRRTVAFSNKQHRKRYADDPEHRARKLAENRTWRVEHREELNSQWSEKWSGDPEFGERRRARYRLRKYGLAPEDYRRMLAEQNGVCAVCKRNSQRGLFVDHCHETQTVGGLFATIATPGSECSTTIRIGCGRAPPISIAGAVLPGRGAERGRMPPCPALRINTWANRQHPCPSAGPRELPAHGTAHDQAQLTVAANVAGRPSRDGMAALSRETRARLRCLQSATAFQHRQIRDGRRP